MNFIMQQLINQKVNSINEHDFLQLAQKQGYTLSHEQATQILKIVHAQKIDVGNKAQIEQIVQRLKRETDPQVATIVEDLFQQYSHLL
ncbi:hypothetical protein JOC54_001350 [Alkalihalobacillus xiaoxiensis]|uniref:DUF2624 domain-containing protein n=1 Tax=Shouchella xiaoxiensis TaxID=766895 RepID=A0ABS2SUG9_9BACI|nr:DUF2624 family protein [Shouchella xiaoxiensis]MBM7838119.1 hypothetical protein [Shouchella xiaoxiensis]